jgi:hypothetical protein
VDLLRLLPLPTDRCAALVAAAWALLLAAPAPVLAATIASSTFETGTDGWTGHGGLVDGSGTIGGSYSWTGSSFRCAALDVHEECFFVAPPDYLGDLTLAYSGTLSFSLVQRPVDGQPRSERPKDVVVGFFGTGDLAIAALIPSADWEGVGSYSVRLDPSAAWRLATFSEALPPDPPFTFPRLLSPGPDLATEAQILAVLAEVTEINLIANSRFAANEDCDRFCLFSGADLDDVALASIPEPAAGALTSAALVALAVAGRRRRAR